VQPLTLFGERNLDSPFVFTVFVALKEKGVPFTFRFLDLARGDQREAPFVARSLTARVPTLSVGDFSFSESLAIVEYLDETLLSPAHPRVLPAGVEERARARQLLGWLRSDLAALRRERPTSSIFFEHERAPAPPGDAARADADKLVRVANTLLAGGDGSPFSSWSVAEADLALALMRLIANGDEVPAAIKAYVEAQWRRPSIAAWVALERPATVEAILA
jgi:glutathione S-transferase